MPGFLKRPKSWIVLLLVLWLASVMYANARQSSVTFYLLPGLSFPIDQLAIIGASALFGVLVTLAVQHQWRRWRAQRKAAAAAPSPPGGASSSTGA